MNQFDRAISAAKNYKKQQPERRKKELERLVRDVLGEGVEYFLLMRYDCYFIMLKDIPQLMFTAVIGRNQDKTLICWASDQCVYAGNQLGEVTNWADVGNYIMCLADIRKKQCGLQKKR